MARDELSGEPEPHGQSQICHPAANETSHEARLERAARWFGCSAETLARWLPDTEKDSSARPCCTVDDELDHLDREILWLAAENARLRAQLAEGRDKDEA